MEKAINLLASPSFDWAWHIREGLIKPLWKIPPILLLFLLNHSSGWTSTKNKFSTMAFTVVHLFILSLFLLLVVAFDQQLILFGWNLNKIASFA
jgi:hypothetical protein